MQNVFFMKEPLAAAEKNVTFVLLNQKQAANAVRFSITTMLAQQKKVVVVALSQSPQELLSAVPQIFREQVIIINCTTSDNYHEKEIIQGASPSNLTSIQVAIDSIEKKMPGDKAIIFDEVNLIASYNKPEVFGKFIHLFSNKMRLKGNTTIYFAVKEFTDEHAILVTKELSDKNFDFSDLLITSISVQ